MCDQQDNCSTRWLLNKEVTTFVADHSGNVITLSGRGGTADRQQPHQEILRTVVRQLEELGYRVEQFSPQSMWSAQQWMIASTPFRMRLTVGRKRLSDLAMVCATGEQAYDRWALELNDARREAERWLQDIAACLHALQRADTSSAERQRQTEVFISARSDLMEVLTEIRYMITRRLPAEPDAS
jgi:hypothetical protein